MDHSGSIGAGKFSVMKNFVKELVDDIGVSNQDTHVGVVKFASGANIEFQLVQYTDAENVKDAIDDVTFIGGGTRTDEGLDTAGDVFSMSGRSGAIRVAVILTDGQANIPQAARDAADRLKGDEDVRIISVGIGQYINKNELIELASNPEDAIHIPEFDEMLKYAKQLVKKICECNYDTSQPTCEWKYRTLNWTCPHGERPKVRAFWGRVDNTTCVDGVHSRFLQNVNCPGSDARTSEAIENWCNARAANGQCRIRAANRKLGGDPCRGTFKYLTACVDCVPECEVATSKPTCEWKYRTLNWTCPDGKRPKVRAFWGRTDNTTCVDEVASRFLQNDNCPGNPGDAAAAIESWCNGGGPHLANGQCRIRAANVKLGGDPCVGTFKYLKACVDCVDAGR